jgi:hypothetical protein
MEVYPEAFWETQDKILRVPFNEDGDQIELKVQLTCAKENIGGGSQTSSSSQVSSGDFDWGEAPTPAAPAHPSQEELDNVRNIMEKLNL